MLFHRASPCANIFGPYRACTKVKFTTIMGLRHGLAQFKPCSIHTLNTFTPAHIPCQPANKQAQYYDSQTNPFNYIMTLSKNTK